MKTRRDILTVMLMLYVASIYHPNVFAQNRHLAGFVKEIGSNRTIDSVNIYAFEEGKKKQISQSDEHGHFVIQYPSTTTALLIEKKGFRVLNIPLGTTPADKNQSWSAGEVFFIHLPLIPLDQQASDRPYMQSEQKDFVLNTDQAGKKKVTRLFKIKNALNNEQVTVASICYEFTKVEKKDCRDITPEKPSQVMVFEDADIINLVVESAGYQTYRGNLILEKMDGSNSVYEIKMTPEVTILTMNVKNFKSEVNCTLMSASGSEVRMTREGEGSFYVFGKTGEYTLNINNAQGGLLHSEKVTVNRGMNYLVVSLSNTLPVHNPIVKPVNQNLTKPAAQLEVSPLADSVRNVTLYFEQSGYVLMQEAKQKLDQLALWLKSSSSRQIRIVGHSDNVGDPKKNETLSEYRARVTYNYLFERGITTQQMKWAAIGGRSPVEKNDSEENKRRNRRVEITLFPEK